MVWLRVSDARGVLRSATALTVAAAGLGLSLMGSGPTAFAAAADRQDTGPIGYSPARDVVQFAPYAVSVTFGTALRDSGASMSIRTKAGEVGQGKVSTSARTLRRAVETGAPNGSYTIEWKAVAVDGRKMSGTFGFTAGHPNNDPLLGGEPGVTVTASPEPTAPLVVKDPWQDDGDSAVPAGSRSQDPPADQHDYGFPLLALGVGALLVIASGLVSRRHRPAVTEQLTIRTSRGIYSV
jgi:methionine-rich copper-binding protein CopC